MKINQTVALVCMVIVASACARSKSDKTSVSIQLPTSAYQSKVAAASYSLLGVDEEDGYDSGWSPEVPTGINSGELPINCYGVIVSFPESSRGFCGRRDAARTLQLHEASAYSFKASTFVGAAPHGTLSLELDPGTGRTFRLIGFHAASIAECRDLTQDGGEHAQMTRPYIISKLENVNLTPGPMTLPMEMSFDPTQWFDDCAGPAFGDGDGVRDPITATKIAISKTFFPENSVFQSNCEAFDIRLTDSLGRSAVLPPGSPVASLQIDGYSSGSTWSRKDTFATLKNCKDDPSGDSSFLIESGKTNVRRWVQTGSGGTTSTFRADLYFNTSTSAYDTPLPLAPSEALQVQIKAGYMLELFGPDVVQSGRKYLYSTFVRSSQLYLQSFSTPVPTMSISISNLGSGSATIYGVDGGNCETTALSSPATITMSKPGGAALGQFCVEFNGPVTSNPLISVSTAGTFTSGSGAGDATKQVRLRGGSTEVHRLRMQGPKEFTLFGTNSKCVGPYIVSINNEAGVEILNGATAILGTLKLLKSDGSSAVVANTYLATQANCTTAMATGASGGVFNAEIGANKSQRMFYLKAANVNEDLIIESTIQEKSIRFPVTIRTAATP